MAKKEFKGNSKQSGKGSHRRPEDFRSVQKNWDKIKWGGQWCAYCGEWGNHTSGGCKILKRDTREVEQQSK